MSSYHSTELDFDSVASTPRKGHEDPRVRFMCSFGGKILPRPHDNQLRYVGGDTRIIAVDRHATFSSLLEKLAKFSGTANITMKYQLPNEDLDALITITNDEDVENMMEEYDRLTPNHSPHPKTARLRLFLFCNDADSRTSSISSLLHGSAKREDWFFDALNGGSDPGLERGRSEASSIVSEVPDYIFGLDNSDDLPREPKLKTRPILNDNVSESDPGSPARAVASPFCSTSSRLDPSLISPNPDMRPVRTKPDHLITVKERSESVSLQQPGYGGSPMWHYGPGGTVYYLSGSVQPPPENVAPQQVPIRAQYVQQFSAPPGQLPAGLHQPVSSMGQVYAREVKPIPEMDPYDTRRAASSGVNQLVFYGMRNAGLVPMYPGMMVPGGEEIHRTRNESNSS